MERFKKENADIEKEEYEVKEKEFIEKMKSLENEPKS
jgi:hypothetical protein